MPSSSIHHAVVNPATAPQLLVPPRKHVHTLTRMSTETFVVQCDAMQARSSMP